MKTISPIDEQAKKVVKRFCDQVFWLRSVRRIYQELFEKSESFALMEMTAPSFFADLNTILHNYLLLEFAKVTDPAESGKKEKENFSVDNLVMSISWPIGIRERLESLSDRTKVFRRHILEARNKLLAHTDKEAFLDERPLGGFPEGEDEVYLETLQEICDVTHEACFGRIFGFMSLPKAGDVINFKATLEDAVAFKKLLADSTGQETTRLYSFLEKARHHPVSGKAKAP